MSARILVVDDEEFNVRLLRKRLTADGYAVSTATSGEEALTLVQQEPPDLILLDAMMPGLDGHQVMERLQATPATAVIPVIFVSANNGLESKLAALEAGAQDYIAKPFEPEELRARVQVALRLKQMRDRLVEEQARLSKEAVTDALTGLYNRRYMDERLMEELQVARAGRRILSVVMLDLDHFKQINDNYGHQVGDAVLREFADLLVSLVRRSDLVGRYGGEEFLILLLDTPPDAAEHVAEKLREAVAEHLFTECGLRVTISIGISSGPRGGSEYEELTELLKRADDSLYQSKRDGRNRVTAR